MSSTAQLRQSELFAGENWDVIYKAFSAVNLQAYDFDTIKQSMVAYIQTNYPENFNDWIDSSEFVFIVDLLAYLGQSLSFRIDLNSRENFLDTAERRESILKWAKTLSYTPKRNYPSRGIFKLSSVKTDQPITDNTGSNISNLDIVWNDPTNTSWYDQFIQVLNSVFVSSNPYGLPIKQQLLTNNITAQLYQLNSQPLTTVTDPFTASINGQNMNFEVVNPDIDATLGIFNEVIPNPLSAKNIIYQNDGAGNSSPNTGFFSYFKQGTLQFYDYQFQYPIENRVVDINVDNINELDVWVQEVNDSGLVVKTWTKVPTTDSIAFTSTDIQNRTIYSVITRDNDQISIKFGDGRFATAPSGLFRIWVRTSNGIKYQINSTDLQNIQIQVPYLRTDGSVTQQYTLTMTYSLQYSINTLDVGSSVPRETTDQIKTRANQVYYTQNRMVNGEDYNIFPLQYGNTARKVKSINRTYSGQSRYIDINDPTGRYQNTKLFAEDGIIYEELFNRSSYENLPTIKTAIEMISSDIQPLFNYIDFRDFFLANYPRVPLDSAVNPTIVGLIPTIWHQANGNGFGTTGEFKSDNGFGYQGQPIGPGSIINYGYLTEGSLVKFVGPTEVLGVITNPTFSSGVDTLIFTSPTIIAAYGVPVTVTMTGTTVATAVSDINANVSLTSVGITAYNTNNQLGILDINGEVITFGGTVQSAAGLPIQSLPGEYTWASIAQVTGNGVSALMDTTGIGPVVLTETIPDGWKVSTVIPSFRRTLNSFEISDIEDQINSHLTFGLRYDYTSGTWVIVSASNLDIDSPFSLANQGDNTNSNLDASWIMLAQYLPGQGFWSFTTRNLRYIFESVIDARFYFVQNFKVVDTQRNLALQDFVRVLKYNTHPSGTGLNIQSGNMPLGEAYEFILIDSFVYPDGFIEPRRVQITFPDPNDTGNPQNPDIFNIIVDPAGQLTSGALTNRYVYQTMSVVNNYEYWIPDTTILTFNDVSGINITTLPNGYVGYAINQAKFYINNAGTITDDSANHKAFIGRNDISFQWNHYVPSDQRIDPTYTNIIDVFVLTETYYQAVQTWLTSVNRPSFPTAPTSDALRTQFSELENFKMISDEMIFHSANFKLLFGAGANEELRAQFKVIPVAGTTLTNNEIQQQVITAINQFFNVDNWSFGETFYYTELGAYIHQQLATIVASVVIVPNLSSNKFGNLFTVQAEPNELFLSTASVSDIVIVNNYTTGNINIGQ